MNETKGLRFFQDNVKELKHRYRDCWIGICPNCGQRELRVFTCSPIEFRCEHCILWGFGVEEFIQKAREAGPSSTRPAEEAKQAHPIKEKTSKTRRCKVCGGPFEFSPFARRKKETCSPKCRKRLQRMRERGVTI